MVRWGADCGAPVAQLRRPALVSLSSHADRVDDAAFLLRADLVLADFVLGAAVAAVASSASLARRSAFSRAVLARTFTVHDKSGAIVVGLADNALFSLSFNGVPEDEAFALARRFDWKGIQAALAK